MHEHHEHPVVVGHGAQQPQHHMAHALERRGADEPEAVRPEVGDLQVRQVEIGQRQPRPVGQVIERMKEVGEGHASEAQQASQARRRRMRDEIGAHILEKRVPRAGEAMGGGGNDRLRVGQLVGQHRLERVEAEPRIARDIGPERGTVCVAQEALDRPVHQAMHAAGSSSGSED